MEEKIRLAVFGQKRLSREGGIPKQSSKGRSHVMGKARHKLAVGFFCLPYS